MRALTLFMFVTSLAWMLPGQTDPKTGPAVGSNVPRFDAPDQNGVRQSLQSIAGPKGAMLVFFRSADW